MATSECCYALIEEEIIAVFSTRQKAESYKYSLIKFGADPDKFIIELNEFDPPSPPKVFPSLQKQEIKSE